MEENELFTYYPEKIRVIDIVPYERFLYYYRNIGRKQLVYFQTLWLNSWRYKYYYLSTQDIYWMLKCSKVDMDDQFMLDVLSGKSANKEYFKIETHLVFKDGNLFKHFEGNKKKIKDYKRSIRNKYTGRGKHQKNTKVVLDTIKDGSTFKDVKNGITKKLSSKTINKILKENDIHLSKKTNSEIKIESKLNDLFNYRVDNVKKKLTYQSLSDYCGVSLRTFKSFIKKNKIFKSNIDDFNRCFNKVQKNGIS